MLQFAFIFLQPESGAAAPCTLLLDTSNFLKQPTSFPTQHASLNSFYTEDPCLANIWCLIQHFFLQRQVYNDDQVGDDDGQGGVDDGQSGDDDGQGGDDDGQDGDVLN